MIYAIVIPSLVLWVFGIPIFALFCLIWNKNTIMIGDNDPTTLEY
jgi:hypothetical protein